MSLRLGGTALLAIALGAVVPVPSGAAPAVPSRPTVDTVVSGATPLADRFEQAVQRIEAGTRMSTWEQLALFLRSWADPDDKIAFRFSAFIAVDDTLTAFVDAEVAKVLPPELGFGGGLANRTASISFGGDGARYVVGYAVS